MRFRADRTEDRAAISVPVCLIPPDNSPHSEFAHTENVSTHGARVMASKLWQAGKSALVRSEEGRFEWTGRVIYCERLPDGKFAVGLQRSRA
ncbi:MAG TPA: PilZ domain-containing protein [Candidatus Acidoferrales bacterium]|nr:PilZ domain-containing protein [Candidatus Acidoferrales bacterium]